MKSNYITNSGIDVSEATMDVTILGKKRKFSFPNNEIMKNIIIAAFNGRDYPIILLPNFILFYSSATSVHRGTNGYISKNVCKVHPGIEYFKK
jgi:hypothetical protein